MESRIAKLIESLIGPAYRLTEKMEGAFLFLLADIFNMMEEPYRTALTNYYIKEKKVESNYEKQIIYHGKNAALPLALKVLSNSATVDMALQGYVEYIDIPGTVDGMVKLSELNKALFGSERSTIITRAMGEELKVKNNLISVEDAKRIRDMRRKGELGGR
ncbi:MAG TPA: hypothetical protein ENH85_12405 [Candidatus Scalindua sp.]|nr:hypothetical protein [Candidatus Scalindua sp.]